MSVEMLPENLRAAVEAFPEPDRTFVREQLLEGQRASWRAKFKDMGEEDCAVCRAARLREQFAASSGMARA